MLERPRDIRSSQKRGPMVDAWGWAALVVAWLTALGGEQPRPEPLGSSCHCNCTCEVEQAICPATASWFGELVKALVFVTFGVISGCGLLGRAVQLIGQGLLKVWAGILQGNQEPPTKKDHLGVEIGSRFALDSEQRSEPAFVRDRALQQLELVRSRRSGRS